MCWTVQHLSARGASMVITGYPAPNGVGAGSTTPRKHNRYKRHRPTKQNRVNNIEHRTSTSALNDFSAFRSQQSSTNNNNRNNNIDSSLRQETRAAMSSAVPQASSRYGRMKPARESGKWRFLYVQANGMADTKARHRKVDGITKLINAFDINGAVLCETGVNWGTLPHDKHMKSWFDNMMDREIKVNTAHNIHGPKTATWQPGGTGMLFTHELLQYARSRDNDFRGLGRWSSWTLQSNPNHRTRVVVAYCPGNRSKNTGLTTVANQHMMYIDEHNLDTRSPY
jgi:hypothetical protein